MLFDDRYEVFLADTAESRNLHYRLRYFVYHEETGWEQDYDVIRTRREKDGFDSCSRHFLVKDKCTHEWVGGMRLIVMPFKELPVTRLCGLVDSVEQASQESCFEISRLFVLPDYRCGSRKIRRGDEDNDQACHQNNAGAYHEIVLGLIRAAREYGYRHNLNNWFFLIEPSLARSIRSLGFDLAECGSGIEHHGLRRPYHSDLHVAFNMLFSRKNEVSKMFLRKKSYLLFSELEVQQTGLLSNHLNQQSAVCQE